MLAELSKSCAPLSLTRVGEHAVLGEDVFPGSRYVSCLQGGVETGPHVTDPEEGNTVSFEALEVCISGLKSQLWRLIGEYCDIFVTQVQAI